MRTEIVREFANAGTAWFVETQPKRSAVTPAATDAELQQALSDLLVALAPSERAAVTRDLRGRVTAPVTHRATGRPQPKRRLDTSPEAVASARRLFGF